jgi:hypothetical protein
MSIRHRQLLRYENKSPELTFSTKKKLLTITSVRKCLSATDLLRKGHVVKSSKIFPQNIWFMSIKRLRMLRRFQLYQLNSVGKCT